jgi:hypothetical protein
MKECDFWTILTFSWRTPLIPTEFNMGYQKSAAGGGQLLWPRTEAKKARFNPGQGFLALGPLVVARVRTELLDFLQEKLNEGAISEAKDQQIRPSDAPPQAEHSFFYSGKCQKLSFLTKTSLTYTFDEL